jgi:hypothetical protein
MTERDAHRPQRIETLDEVELSVHHTVTDRPRHSETYELHAGFADVVEVPEQLVERVKTVTGVDIRTERVQCGAEIRVISVE